MNHAFAILDNPIATTPPQSFDVDGFGSIKIPFGYLLETDLRNAWQKQTFGLPNHIKRTLYKKLKSRIERDSDKDTSTQIKAVEYGIMNLTSAVKLLRSVIKPESLWLTQGKLIEGKAKVLVNKTNATIGHLVQTANGSDEIYKRLLTMVVRTVNAQFYDLGVIPPFGVKTSIEELESIVVRYQNEKFVNGYLERQAAQLNEHIEIIMGNVNGEKSPYCSRTCLNQFVARHTQQEDWLKSMFVQDKNDESNVFSLFDAFNSSVSNKTLRRFELMTRIRGLEDLAAKDGYAASLVTITAPSKYHANSGRKFNGSNPRQTQKYLTKMWANCRSKLNRDDIPFFGLRVVEPHKDATPHWHIVLFYKPEDKHDFQTIITHYATKEDRHELNDEFVRCDFMDIDPSKGSATGYIAKYVAKNIDAAHVAQDLDGETGKPLEDSLNSVLAWASRWRIRQFQFLGGASVTVWRECRRFMKDFSLGDLEHDGHFQGISFLPNFRDCLDYADSGNYGGFVSASGGVFQGRSGLLKTHYERFENEYGEEVPKVKGFSYQGFEFTTRETEYRIVSESDLLNSASGASWSADNNCPRDLSHEEMLWQQIQQCGSQLQKINKYRFDSEPTKYKSGEK